MTGVELIVIGVSAGATETLGQLLTNFPIKLPMPCVIVQHLHPWQTHTWIQEYDRICPLPVKEAEDKEQLQSNFVYFAPPNYHLMINDDKAFALSIDPKVNFSRPSIDVLFESAVDVYDGNLIGVILTGGSHDGAAGLKAIYLAGGVVIVQEPETAVVPFMPRATLAMVPEAQSLSVLDISLAILQLTKSETYLT